MDNLDVINSTPSIALDLSCPELVSEFYCDNFSEVGDIANMCPDWPKTTPPYDIIIISLNHPRAVPCPAHQKWVAAKVSLFMCSQDVCEALCKRN